MKVFCSLSGFIGLVSVECYVNEGRTGCSDNLWSWQTSPEISLYILVKAKGNKDFQNSFVVVRLYMFFTICEASRRLRSWSKIISNNNLCSQKLGQKKVILTCASLRRSEEKGRRSLNSGKSEQNCKGNMRLCSKNSTSHGPLLRENE